jgi:mannose-6-phosphate isomerase-like protein (cupin superfamily)
MKILAGGCAVIPPAEDFAVEGTRRYTTPICRAMGARDIAVAIGVYTRGTAPARRNPFAEEVLYVVSGAGLCRIDGRPHAIGAGTGVYVPASSVYQITAEGDEPLRVVSVSCPEDDGAGVVAPPAPAPGEGAPRRTISEAEARAIPTGNRSFKVLADPALGCRRVTQFVGEIPPGTSPPHSHTYEEAIFILQGEGRVWTPGGEARFGPGWSIYLPPGVRHALENMGTSVVRLLGVFYPSGSPAARYEG